MISKNMKNRLTLAIVAVHTAANGPSKVRQLTNKVCHNLGPDATFVVTGSEDKTARIWDVATGAELMRLDHTDWVTSVAVSPLVQRAATMTASFVFYLSQRNDSPSSVSTPMTVAHLLIE